MVISINVVVDADQVIIEVARFRAKDSNKALTRAVGKDSFITPLLEIESVALLEEKRILQSAAREFAASTVIKWVTSQRTAGLPSGNHLVVAVADKLDVSKIECQLSATRWLNANKKSSRLPERGYTASGIKAIFSCGHRASPFYRMRKLFRVPGKINKIQQSQLLVVNCSQVTISDF